jgi:tight adherence protein C
MLIAIFVLILISINLLFYALSEKGERKLSLSGKMSAETTLRKPNPLLVVFIPLSRLLLSRGKARETLRTRLTSIKSNMLPEEFFSLKLISAAALPFLAFALLGKEQPASIFIGAAIGLFLPEVWLNHKIRAHKTAIQRVLPETIDLLALCIGAGLDFTGAVRWITEKAKSNPMIEELKFVLSEIKVGKPRLEALKDMAKRLQILDVASFVHNLVLAERMGTPVEETFAILSDDMRLRRTQRGERQALKAPIKILIPLIFCILPIILIVVAGPVLIRFMEGGLFSIVK